MNIKFIFCIILGIILYILINKIEGLRCRGPLDVALGNPDPSATIGKLNNGSLPFFPKDNVMVTSRVDGQIRYISENSKDNTWDNGTIFELKCSRGLRDEEDIHRKKLAPYTPLTSQGNRLTCHTPSKKVIFYNIHGSIQTQEIIRTYSPSGLIKSSFTFIPKKMQLIFYINEGNCHEDFAFRTDSDMNNIFTNIYNEQNMMNLIQPTQDTDNSLFNEGFSELETIDDIYMLFIDIPFIDLMQDPGHVYRTRSDMEYSVECSYEVYSSSIGSRPNIYRTLFTLDHKNILKLIGPYCQWFPIIDFSSHPILDTIRIYSLLVEDYVRVEFIGESRIPTGHENETLPVTLNYTYDMVHMENLKKLIRDLMLSQSVMVPINYLSEEFRSNDSFRRIFNGNVEIELPIFCPSILSYPYFINPVGTIYALPGGRYIYQDLINLIFDIIGQITSDEESVVKSVYYRKMRSLGMSDDEIDTFLSQCNFLYTHTNIQCNIPENFPLLPFMNLWEPWNYPTTDISDHIIYDWSMQTFLLLIQLFKQEEGEAIDVHSFTCLEGIGEGDRTKNNAKMDYSWQYAYSDEEANDEANNPDKRIGPECQRPVCPQTEGEINRGLIESQKAPFIVDSESYSSEQNRYPKSREITYTKNDEGNITIDRDYIEPTGITVQCSNRPEITEKLICKYDEDAEETLNYDESIEQLDPSRCLDASQIQVISGQPAYNLADGGVGIYQDPNNLDQTIYIGELTEQTACGVRLNFGV